MEEKTNYRKYQDEIQSITSFVLAEFAPEELDLVDPLVEKYFALSDTGEVSVFPNDTNEIPLGFSGNVDLLATIVIPVIVSTLGKLMELLTVEKLRQVQIENTQKKESKNEISFAVNAKFDKVKDELVITISRSGVSKKQAKELSAKILDVTLKEIKKRASRK